LENGRRLDAQGPRHPQTANQGGFPQPLARLSRVQSLKILRLEQVLLGDNVKPPRISWGRLQLHHAFGHLWTGFYRVVEPGRLLRVGPYQGSLGCQEITFGRGVCGTAAAERRTVVVEDVHDFPGHITCDPRSHSEIVVPVFDVAGALIAVLDIDSSVPAAFGEADRVGLEQLVAWFARAPYVPVPV
jgi:GAF domain-containing protein